VVYLLPPFCTTEAEVANVYSVIEQFLAQL
jgi:adenosylmethionine-8-amino-7-oxononanoate aminotransferase